MHAYSIRTQTHADAHTQTRTHKLTHTYTHTDKRTHTHRREGNIRAGFCDGLKRCRGNVFDTHHEEIWPSAIQVPFREAPSPSPETCTEPRSPGALRPWSRRHGRPNRWTCPRKLAPQRDQGAILVANVCSAFQRPQLLNSQIHKIRRFVK